MYKLPTMVIRFATISPLTHNSPSIVISPPVLINGVFDFTFLPRGTLQFVPLCKQPTITGVGVGVFVFVTVGVTVFVGVIVGVLVGVGVGFCVSKVIV